MTDKDRSQALHEIVNAGKIMQLATLNRETPWLCHVWYATDWDKNRLLFTSNPIRNHSKHIEENSNVAGALLAQEFQALGQKVQGVTFTGQAKMVPNSDLDEALQVFLGRWPTDSLDAEKIRSGHIPNRLYEVRIILWVLHDEVNFPANPRFEWQPTN